jgi:hypothetical protein
MGEHCSWSASARPIDGAGKIGDGFLVEGFKSYVPDHEECQLLHALLDGNPESAQSAACAWLDKSDLRNLNEGHRRLMPLLSYRISSWKMKHQKLAVLSQEYKRYWMSTQRMHYQADIVVESLSNMDTPIVMLKGVALGRTVYPNAALRPFTDIDLLVHPRSFLDAQKRLLALGYTIGGVSPKSTVLLRDGSPEIDLHRTPYHEVLSEELVSPIFTRIVALSQSSRNCYRLGNEDELLHTLAHGLRTNPVSPLRWIVDSALLLRASEQSFDWALFYREAMRLDLVEVASRALVLLNDVCAGVIDPPTLEALERRRTTVTKLWFVVEREWKGPSEVWGHHRRNRTWLETLKGVRDQYRATAAREGIGYLAKRALLRALKIVTGNFRN